MIDIEIHQGWSRIEPIVTHSERILNAQRTEVGTVILGGLGVGILTPSFNAVISIRVSDKDPIQHDYQNLGWFGCKMSWQIILLPQKSRRKWWKIEDIWKLHGVCLSGARQAFFTGLALGSFSASYREECLWLCLCRFSVQWADLMGPLCQFVRRDVDAGISDCLPCAHFAFSICERLSDKSRWLSWTLFVAWHLDSCGHNCFSTAPRSNWWTILLTLLTGPRDDVVAGSTNLKRMIGRRVCLG